MKHNIRAIYCIGRNYGAHAKEMGNAVPSSPVVFLKSPSAVRGPGDQGRIAYPDETYHHEIELALRIGSTDSGGTLLPRVDAVALGRDLTRREVQNRLKKEGLPWTEAKSFVGAAVLSSFIPVDDVCRKFKQTCPSTPAHRASPQHTPFTVIGQ